MECSSPKPDWPSHFGTQSEMRRRMGQIAASMDADTGRIIRLKRERRFAQSKDDSPGKAELLRDIEGSLRVTEHDWKLKYQEYKDIYKAMRSLGYQPRHPGELPGVAQHDGDGNAVDFSIPPLDELNIDY